MPQAHEGNCAETIEGLLAAAGYAPVLDHVNHALAGVPGFVMMKWVRLDRPARTVYKSIDGPQPLFTFRAENPPEGMGQKLAALASRFLCASAPMPAPAAVTLGAAELSGGAPEDLPGGCAPALYCRLTAMIHRDRFTPFFVRSVSEDHRTVTLSAHMFPSSSGPQTIKEQARRFAQGHTLTLLVPAEKSTPVLRLQIDRMIKVLSSGAREHVCALEDFVLNYQERMDKAHAAVNQSALPHHRKGA